MSQTYDSTEDTKKHIARVAELLTSCIACLAIRSHDHDRSKLEEPEKPAFDAVIQKLKDFKYGSEEYKASLRETAPALAHHYAHNSHHPEHFPFSPQAGKPLRELVFVNPSLPEGVSDVLLANASEREAQVNGMSLFDVMEMLMDWKAAGERMAGGGSIEKSIEINTTRFNLSPQLVNILRNTAQEMGWIEYRGLTGTVS